MDKIHKIDADHPDEWYKDRFMVRFTGEGIMDPRRAPNMVSLLYKIGQGKIVI